MSPKKLNYTGGDNLPLYATPEQAMREGQRREELERRRRQKKHEQTQGRSSSQPQLVSHYPQPAMIPMQNAQIQYVPVHAQPPQRQPLPMQAMPPQQYVPMNMVPPQVRSDSYLAHDKQSTPPLSYSPNMNSTAPARRSPPQRKPPVMLASVPPVSSSPATPGNRDFSRSSVNSVDAGQQNTQDIQIAAQLFSNHDIKNMGRLTAGELQNLLQNDDNTHFCVSAVEALINLFGASRFGTVNLNEFTSLYKRVKKWRKVYVDNDINGSFTISASEYHNCLQELGYLVPYEVSESLFDQYGEFIEPENHVRELKFDKFVESLVWLMRLTKVFRKHDEKQEGVATIQYKDFIDVVLYLGRFLPR
ncbi:LAMI_0A03532g1_1 [Lachancea mirantina]|uniref:LAMI_0A03532g1_1 n=1 Tax=Lachancea mirantina TaxID=1230905 RepID=A0A1G4IN59_9SACH|nr:LAMI_0A03532g1_1 [Lachancea mirantina]